MDDKLNSVEQAALRAMDRYMDTLQIYLNSTAFKQALQKQAEEAVNTEMIFDSLRAASDESAWRHNAYDWCHLGSTPHHLSRRRECLNERALADLGKPARCWSPGGYELTEADWAYLKEMAICQ
jgi:hypothetical protein